MNRILKLYTEENLGKVTTRIIESYRNNNRSELNELARGAGLNPDDYRDNRGKLFKRLVVSFHPDRLARFHRMIRRYGESNNKEALERMEKKISLAFKDYSPPPEIWETTYATDEEIIRSAEDSWDKYEEGLSLREESAEDWGFIEAVKNMMYGNLFSDFLPKDLLYLEGMLNLADRDIEDLTGLEYCRNLTGLNLEGNRIDKLDRLENLPYLTTLYLAGNRIDEISSLGRLTGLKTVDLAFNEVEDIAPLLNLPDLEYVNLMGNPLKDSEALSSLSKRCLLIRD